MKYFAKIAFVGRDFAGFQYQPAVRTVQGELTRAMSALFGSPTAVTGCSRTDAGVHAREFCVTLDNPNATIPPERLPMAAAQFLPQDISLFYAKKCADDFHPRYSAWGKEYIYRIWNAPARDPFLAGLAWHIPRPISDEALAHMQEAAAHFIGKRDCRALMASHSSVTDTVRQIRTLRVAREGDTVTVTVSADGFLYHMVRIIVGTLLDVAFGKLSPADIPAILAAGDRSAAGPTAPPDGLYLNRVFYEDPRTAESECDKVPTASAGCN